MKARELRELGAEELAQRIRETSQDLRNLRLKKNTGSGSDNPLRKRLLRREVARMLTIQRAREASK
jgi:large subunit ribosomal protein L29